MMFSSFRKFSPSTFRSILMDNTNRDGLPIFLYAICGAAFGALFPICAYVIHSRFTGNSFWQTILDHENGVFFVVDLAPLILGAFAIAIGVRENRIKRLAQDKTRSRLEEAELVGGYGSWEMDIQSSTVKWSKGLYKLYGIDPSQPPSYDEFMKIVHPDDREAAMNNAARIFSERPSKFTNELRIITRDTGETRYYRSQGELVVNQLSGADKIVGTTHDVTEVTEARIAALEVTKLNAELEAINAMAVMYKHEINNPLAIAIGSLEVLDESLRGHPSIERSHRALLRIADLIKRSGDVSESGQFEFVSYANTDVKMLKIT
ncbi:MAG: hypothetical protein EOP06_08000 [Proteobacteria bacterium]|nr:MAG: hypothetical protein EOP06_08000 [Pseudomonadota bacterium]